jgi:hypothetical protein
MKNNKLCKCGLPSLPNLSLPCCRYHWILAQFGEQAILNTIEVSQTPLEIPALEKNQREFSVSDLNYNPY